ncbi:hypothetical protein CerSpe_117240 [Prunus speciosa]
MATSNCVVSLKLLIDTKQQKVLFAEAGKDFVDFLFTLLSLPLGTIIRLLSKDEMVGSLGRLYGSLETLSDIYMQPNLNKDTLLKPKAQVAGQQPSTFLINMLITNDGYSSSTKKLYVCRSCRNYSSRPYYVSDDPKALCPQCINTTISTQAIYVAPPNSTTGGETSSGKGGYVKGVVTYMITDDLEVKPMSSISCIAVLNKFNVKDVSALEEKVVHLGMQEGVLLLKASLQSKSVLTNVFLGKK